MIATSLIAVTSTITVAEVLIHPFRQNADHLRQQYLNLFLNTASLEVRSIDIDVAESAAELRARHNIRLPDALQIAVALQSDCDAFITNDKQLLRVSELTVLVLDDFAESMRMSSNPSQKQP